MARNNMRQVPLHFQRAEFEKRHFPMAEKIKTFHFHDEIICLLSILNITFKP